jgi:hypothetical protein
VTKYIWLLVGLLWVASLPAQGLGVWESRGDAFTRARRHDRALSAYQKGLAQDPDNKRILKKYQRAFLEMLSQKSADAPEGSRQSLKNRSQVGRVSRFGRVSRLGRNPRRRVRKPDDEVKPDENEPEEGEEILETSETPGEEAGEIGEEPDEEPDDELGEEDSPRKSSKPKKSKDDDEEEDDGLGSRERRYRRGGFGRVGYLGYLGRPPSRGVRKKKKGPKYYGGSQNVEVNEVRQGFEGAGGVQAENTVVETTRTRITEVKLSYKGRDLHVTGMLENISGTLIKLPRVYCTIYDETGIMRGRNFSYLSPGRNSIARKKKKKFDVVFHGYNGTVSSYQFQVIP